MSLITQTKQIGRPLKWKDPKWLEEQIDIYYKECQEKGEAFTLSELAVRVGSSRRQLIEYGARDGFYNALKRARSIAESQVEKQLFSGKSPIGAIFVAKNNFGWVDKTEVEHSGQLSITSLVSKLEGKDTPLEEEFIEGEIVEDETIEDEEMAQ